MATGSSSPDGWVGGHLGGAGLLRWTKGRYGEENQLWNHVELDVIMNTDLVQQFVAGEQGWVFVVRPQ